MATPKDVFKKLPLALHHPTIEQEQILQDVINLIATNSSIDLAESLRGSDLLLVLAHVLEENVDEWKQIFPAWVGQLLTYITPLRDVKDLLPLGQVTALTNAFKKYVMNESWNVMYAFSVSAMLPTVKSLLVHDDELYNMIKKGISEEPNCIVLLSNCSAGFELWQYKILEDKQLVLDLLSLPESEDIWRLFVVIAQHPDAKTLLPKEVLIKASKSTDARCTDICALLCGDNDLSVLKIDNAWMVHITGLLESLVNTGQACVHKVFFSLLRVLLPIANVSVVDAFKDELGKRAVVLLLRIITEQLPNVASIQLHLQRGRQEASRALWNFAYLESNRKLISSVDGITKLNETMKQTDDKILQQNIAGVLHMFNSPSIVPQTKVASKGHVMVSYNWGNQPIVLRLAQSLKDQGYSVWLDVEQMEGSTLEAMASAIERSDMVLICMSQKYKDSPNCRLEGEYCMNRKIPFVPLMMQQGYSPDGWLGITLGSKLWYSFADDSNWDSKMKELTKAIGDRGRGATSSPPKPVPVLASPTPSNQKQVVDWNAQDILKWMKANDIEHHYHRFTKHKFTGKALAELKRLHSLPSPSFSLSFFVTMCKDLGITEYGEILLLSSAVSKL